MTDEAAADAYTARLILDILEAAGEPLDEDEIQAIANWIDEVRTDRSLLTLFERGEMRIRWREGGPVFYARPKVVNAPQMAAGTEPKKPRVKPDLNQESLGPVGEAIIRAQKASVE